MAVTTVERYWKRIGYIAIEDRSGNMVKFGGSNDSLDFKFDGEKVGDIYPRFKCGVLGLSTQHIQEFTVWNQAESVKRSRKIQVFAGYEKDGITNPIFEGFVLTAIPTNPPEMWLNFDCLLSLNQSVPIEKQYVLSSTKGYIFKKIAEELGLGSKWDAKNVSEKDEAEFAFKGSKSSLAKRFSDAFKVTVYNDGGILRAVDSKAWYGDVKDAVTVSTDTGMLGLGNVTMAGATVRMRLNDNAKLLSWINLKSSIIPSANGNYFVIRKRHVGHFRGEEWHTELECIRKQGI